MAPRLGLRDPSHPLPCLPHTSFPGGHGAPSSSSSPPPPFPPLSILQRSPAPEEHRVSPQASSTAEGEQYDVGGRLWVMSSYDLGLRLMAARQTEGDRAAAQTAPEGLVAGWDMPPGHGAWQRPAPPQELRAGRGRTRPNVGSNFDGHLVSRSGVSPSSEVTAVPRLPGCRRAPGTPPAGRGAGCPETPDSGLSDLGFARVVPTHTPCLHLPFKNTFY